MINIMRKEVYPERRVPRPKMECWTGECALIHKKRENLEKSVFQNFLDTFAGIGKGVQRLR